MSSAWRKIARYREANASPINKVYLYEEYPHALKPCREALVNGRPVGGSGLDLWIDRARLWLRAPREAPAPAPAASLQKG